MKQWLLFISLITSLTIGSAQSQRILQRDSLIQDIALLQEAFLSIHPGIYRYNNPQTAKAIFTELAAQLPAQLTEGAFLKRLAQQITKIKCGHTYVNPWNMDPEVRQRLMGGPTYFPLGFEVIDQQLYVTHNLSEFTGIERGAEILSINGVSSAVILDSLTTIGRQDGNNPSAIPAYLALQNFAVRNWEAFDIYFPLFFPLSKPSFDVRYQNYGAAQPRETTLSALSKDERAARYQQQTKIDQGELRWTLDCSDPELAVMNINTFAIWNWKDFDHKAWFADAFAQLKTAGIPNLAIDIRTNGGGLGEPRDELLSYLLRSPIPCSEQPKALVRTVRIDSTLRPYCDTWVEILFEGLPEAAYRPHSDGFYELSESFDCNPLAPKTETYTGRVFLLGGAANVSATFTMLETARKQGFGTFVGTPTGGNQQGINGGEYIFFRLPYSKMEVDLPLKYFSRGSNRPDAGISPDILAPLTQKAIAEQQDPVLERVRALIH